MKQMKKVMTILLATLCCWTLSAQQVDMFRAIPCEKYLTNIDYINGNKYQKDAIIFLDVISDTHPYYIEKSRREELLSRLPELYRKCADIESEDRYVELLGQAISEVHDKHTDLMPYQKYLESRVGTETRADEQPAGSSSPMEYRDQLFWFETFPEYSICYLQFNKCADARTLKDDSYPRFNRTLAEMFGKMEEEGINTLIVDVQYNGGGSSRLCSELIDMIYPTNQLKSWSNYLRFSNLLAMMNPKTSSAKERWEESGNADKLYPMPASETAIPEHEVFEGKVIFVQGPKTFSSAGILITDARDNGIGTIVGTTSTFSPSHYGEVLPYKLPNTGILGSVCCKYFERPDKEHAQDMTLEPDIYVDLSDKVEAWNILINEFGTKK